MGWLSYYISTSPKKELDRLYNWEDKKEDGTVVKRISTVSSCLRGSHYYAAVKVEDLVKNTVDVNAVCCLTYYSPKAKSFNFGYKPMDETMGPCLYDCPETILKVLTPIESKFANEWRQKNWENINKKKILNSLPVDSVISFSRGDEVITVKKRKWSKRTQWENSFYYFPLSHIPANFEIIKKGDK